MYLLAMVCEIFIFFGFFIISLALRTLRFACDPYPSPKPIYSYVHIYINHIFTLTNAHDEIRNKSSRQTDRLISLERFSTYMAYKIISVIKNANKNICFFSMTVIHKSLKYMQMHKYKYKQIYNQCMLVLMIFPLIFK